MAKVKKNLGIGQILAAAVFLFNPNISVVDFLPDVFGYLLLVSGLSCFADLNDSIAEARDLFRRMIFVSAAEIVAFVWVFGLSNLMERANSMLLLPFVFGLMSVLFLLPAYRKLFTGTLYLGTRNDGTSVFRRIGGKEYRHGSYSDRIFYVTAVYIVLKPVFSFLPELLSLTVDLNANGAVGAVSPLYSSIGALRFLTFLFTLPLGIAWLVMFSGYWKNVRKETAFTQKLEDQYRENILPKRSLFEQRDLRAVLLLFSFFAVFSVDLNMAEANLLPDFVAALLCFLAVLRARKLVPKYRASLILSIAYFVFSLCDWVVYFVFTSKFDSSMLHGGSHLSELAASYEAAWNAFYGACVVGTLSEILFIALVASVIVQILIPVVRRYTGYIAVNQTEEKRKLEQRPMVHRLFLTLGAAVLLAAGECCFRYFSPFNRLMSFFSFIVSALFLVFWFVMMVELRDQIKDHYRYD